MRSAALAALVCARRAASGAPLAEFLPPEDGVSAGVAAGAQPMPRRPPRPAQRHRKLPHAMDGCPNAVDELDWMPATRYAETVGGYDRLWYVYTAGVPAGATSVPLVLDLHGWISCVSDVAYVSGWSVLASQEGFVVVYPAGTQDLEEAGTGTIYHDDTGWNAGTCCGSAYYADVDDVAFLRRVVEAVSDDLGYIDSTRVYAAGHSNGASMVNRLALEAPDLVAGVAAFGGYALTGPGTLFQPTPYFHAHGVDDATVAYDQACCDDDVAVCFDTCDYYIHENFELQLERWTRWNACDGDAAVETGAGYTTRTYDSCNSGADVAFVALDGVDHWPYYDYFGLYPGWPESSVETSRMAWDFLKTRVNTYDAAATYDYTTATPGGATASPTVSDAPTPAPTTPAPTTPAPTAAPVYAPTPAPTTPAPSPAPTTSAPTANDVVSSAPARRGGGLLVAVALGLGAAA